MDKKEEFREKWQKQIDQLGSTIDELKAKAMDTSAEARDEISERLQGLEGQREKAKVKMNEMLEAGEGVWDEVSDEAEELFGKLKTGIDGLLSRLGGDDDNGEEVV